VSEDLSLDVVRREDAIEISVAGEVDLATARILAAELRTAIEAGVGTVVVDGAGLTYIDSSGINCLVGAACDAASSGRRLVVRNPSDIALRVFEIAKVDGLLLEDSSRDGAWRRCRPA
jgi:anti-sigma B factor antagonist